MKKNAFSLIELLVVTAILAILFACLMPALKSARESAKTIICLSNQKQIVTALAMYAGENSGLLPPFRGPDPPTPWYNGVSRYLGATAKWNKCPALPKPASFSIGACSRTVFPDYVPKYLTQISPRTAAIGDVDNPWGGFLGPAGAPFSVDIDGDGIKDGYNASYYLNALVFRHQNLAVVGIMDGSVRKISILDWVKNNDGLWGP